jgi:hypothetical protein
MGDFVNLRPDPTPQPAPHAGTTPEPVGPRPAADLVDALTPLLATGLDLGEAVKALLASLAPDPVTGAPDQFEVAAVFGASAKIVADLRDRGDAPYTRDACLKGLIQPAFHLVRAAPDSAVLDPAWWDPIREALTAAGINPLTIALPLKGLCDGNQQAAATAGAWGEGALGQAIMEAPGVDFALNPGHHGYALTQAELDRVLTGLITDKRICLVGPMAGITRIPDGLAAKALAFRMLDDLETIGSVAAEGEFIVTECRNLCHLPDILKAGGAVRLEDLPRLTRFPSIIRGNPEIARKDRALHLNGCPLPTAPPWVDVPEGEIDTLEVAEGTALLALPPGLREVSHLHVQECASLRTLWHDAPPQIGTLALFDCAAVEELPADLVVDQTLTIRACAHFRSLPEGLQVNGDGNHRPRATEVATGILEVTACPRWDGLFPASLAVTVAHPDPSRPALGPNVRFATTDAYPKGIPIAALRELAALKAPLGRQGKGQGVDPNLP